MSCVASDPKFRLLDHLVGWDEDDFAGLTGLYDGDGVRLEGGTDGITASDLDPFIPPPRLAPGCNPCDWYLATNPAPRSRILALDGCDNEWSRLSGCFPVELQNAVAIAVDRHLLAVADAATGKVWLLHLGGWQIAGEIDVTDPVDLAFGPDMLAIAHKGGSELLFAARNGRIAGTWPGSLPPGPVARIAYDRTGLPWLVTRKDADRFLLYRQEGPESAKFVPATLEELAAAFERLPMLYSSRAGFCLLRGGPSGTDDPTCYDWFGRPLAQCAIGAPAASGGYATQGQLLTGPIDSGEPRCLWHRIRIVADIPPNTGVAVALATSEEPAPAAQGVAPADWAAFPSGVPHPGDWQDLGSGITDALIRQPVGRYLFLRIRLTGDGSDTPRVHRVRLDLPRSTSADLLPAVYREEAEAGEFTERFLALFDATLEGVETAVARFPSLLDTRRVPADALPWIARFLGVTFDESWDADTRRRVLAGAPDLFRKRGTPGGLRRAIELVYGEDAQAVVTEHGAERSWGAVAGSGSAPGDARLGSVRLFSRQRSRMTLGASPIGTTRVMSFGDPATDPHSAGAFRFTLAVSPQAGGDTGALLRLIEGLKPGHTLAHVREGGSAGFLLGKTLQLGIDTVIRRPAPQAFGDPNLRLGRGSVLGGTPKPAPILGRSPLTSPPTSCTE